METQYQVSLPSTSSPIGFGWHVDDYDSIIKFFYFPTKVDCTNGPLKIIEGTARYQNYYQAFKWLVFRRTFKDQYYSDTEISKSLLRNEKKLILKKNSLVAVDTSSLHSSSILEDGERRVMVFLLNQAGKGIFPIALKLLNPKLFIFLSFLYSIILKILFQKFKLQMN